MQSDKTFNFIISPIVKALGYSVTRSDMLPSPGLISSQIIHHLFYDDLVIADLSGNNPNVLYELAFRHTQRKPVIQIMSKGETLPFDVTNNRTIFFDHNDLESAEQCKDSLKSQILSIEANPNDVENPITVALDSIKVQGSSSLLEKLMGDIYSQIDNIPEQLNLIQSKIRKVSEITTGFNKGGTNAEAEFIDGETEAFATITEITRCAKNTVRSTRFFPESVLTQPAYVNAMEQRILGTDGNPPLKRYYRIVAINNQQKQKDINHHLNNFAGKPFNLYLTSNENAFELVIVDDKDVFIHFHKEEKVIASTLHIRGKLIVNEFIEIFNKLKARDLIKEFNCERITQRSLITSLAETDKIFGDKFPESDQDLI